MQHVSSIGYRPTEEQINNAVRQSGDRSIPRRIEQLFTMMEKAWPGKLFTSRDLPEDKVFMKRLWARKLETYTGEELLAAFDKSVMRYANWVPTIGQFAAICEEPRIEQKRMESFAAPPQPKSSDPEVAKQHLAEIRKLIARPSFSTA